MQTRLKYKCAIRVRQVHLDTNARKLPLDTREYCLKKLRITKGQLAFEILLTVNELNTTNIIGDFCITIFLLTYLHWFLLKIIKNI